jgi:hypothetical protein
MRARLNARPYERDASSSSRRGCSRPAGA